LLLEETGISQGFSEWSYVALLFLLFISFMIYELGRRASNKKIIKAYTRLTIDPLEKDLSYAKLKRIGEFKGQSANEERRTYEFQMRHNFKYFTLQSTIPFGQYESYHMIERTYIIQYSFRAQVFKVKLPKDEWYFRDLGWSLQAYFYRFFTFCFNLSSTGIVISPLIMGAIFSSSFPEITWAILVGILIGLIISTINWGLQKAGKISKSLLKKKKVHVKEDMYIAPLESEEEIYEIYKVEGTIQKPIETSDKAKKYETMKLSHESKKIDPKTKKPKIKNYIKVNGFDELLKLIDDPLIKIKKKKVIDIARRKRTSAEMLSLHRSYLTRNRSIVEDIFGLRRENERIQREYRELQVQLRHVEETKDQELKEYAIASIKKMTERRNTLKHLYADIWGEKQISNDFATVHEKVMRRLRNEETNEQFLLLKDLIYAFKELMKEVAKRLNLEPTHLIKMLELKHGGGNGETKGDQEKKD